MAQTGTKVDRSAPSRSKYRERIVAYLAVFSSEVAQRLLGSAVDRDRLAYELSRCWFDELYVPSGRYIDGLKGDFSAEQAEQFRDAFDPVELTAMERFHRFFELRIEMVAPANLQRRRIPVDHRWESLTRHAGYLLEDLTAEAVGIRNSLETRLRHSDDLPAEAARILEGGHIPR